eukprot:766435-Hanusia_phi.AAC.2
MATGRATTYSLRPVRRRSARATSDSPRESEAFTLLELPPRRFKTVPLDGTQNVCDLESESGTQAVKEAYMM